MNPDENSSEKDKALSLKDISFDDIYNILFLNAKNGIVLINYNSGEIQDANIKFQRQTNYSLDKLKNLKISELLNTKKKSNTKEQFNNLKQIGEEESVELEILREDKSIIPLSFSFRQITINNNKYLICTTYDLTEAKETESELLKQRDELDSFTSTIAHDLRGKLQIIKMFNDLTVNSIYKDKIIDQINEMGMFLDNLLLLAKKGKIIGYLTNINLIRILGELKAKVETIDPKLKIYIDNLPVVIGDDTQIKQVFENLIFNVIKHAKANTIKIYSESDLKYTKIIVQDDGIGISEQDQEQIQKAWITNRGTSFGLLIVKKISIGEYS